ncbi:ovalbumin-related protein Y [Cydia splendana]|uniref:ovalbumin-related protein Y n=1 Tax=Cydia splendana TaxID=1100963 RepID=UPI002129EE25
MRILFVLCLAVGLSSARWVRRGRAPPKTTGFVGEATNQLSTAIFQGYIDDNKNIAFSPLGYSAILAILAEGATGQTREQLVSALHLPDDPNLIRKTYRFIMERLKNTHEYKYNQPELKNYFYIYKNYTINDDYKKMLEDYYLTDVRSVERYNDVDHFKPNETNDDDDETIEISDKKAEESNKNEEIVDLVPPKESGEKFISFAVEDKPEKVDISQIEYKPAKNIKEKIKLVKTYPKKDESGEEEETMVAVEARNHARSHHHVLQDKSDIASSISVNTVGKKSGKTSPSNSLMLIFNGMYFRGAWKQPFLKVEPAMFYTSNSEKKQVQMMCTKGIFKTGSLPGLDSSAIELPYDGGRYSLLIVLPRTRDGLTRLTADLPAAPLEDIQDSLREEELQVSLPTFYVETTTKPVAALAKFGVSSIFSRDAELSGVSSAEGLFVQELVQHVAVRVDNADTSATQLSASNAVQESLKNIPLSSIKEPRRFSVDRPFMFFIIDRLDNLIVIAGKVIDPEAPTPFEI